MLSYNLTHTCNKDVTPSGLTSALFLEICGTDMILKTTNKRSSEAAQFITAWIIWSILSNKPG